MERHPDGRYRIEFQPSSGSPEVLARAKKYRVAAILYNQHYQQLLTEGAHGILALYERPVGGHPMVLNRIASPEQIHAALADESNQPDFTDQERIIHRQLRELKTPREIADELHLSQRSLGRHIHNLGRKIEDWRRQQLDLPPVSTLMFVPFEQWQPVENWTCPHCGSVFAIQSFQLSQKIRDHIICSVCEQILRAWHEAIDFQAVLIERHDPPDES